MTERWAISDEQIESDLPVCSIDINDHVSVVTVCGETQAIANARAAAIVDAMNTLAMPERDRSWRDAGLSLVGVERVEHSVAPPMRAAVTLPVIIDGKDSGACVYVAYGAFAPRTVNAAWLVKSIARRLRLV